VSRSLARYRWAARRRCSRLGRAASSVRERLGESLATVRRFDVPLEQATTPSLEALRAYALVSRRGGIRDQAIPSSSVRWAGPGLPRPARSLDLRQPRRTDQRAHHARIARRRDRVTGASGSTSVPVPRRRRRAAAGSWVKATYPRDFRPANALAVSLTARTIRPGDRGGARGPATESVAPFPTRTWPRLPGANRLRRQAAEEASAARSRQSDPTPALPAVAARRNTSGRAPPRVGTGSGAGLRPGRGAGTGPRLRGAHGRGARAVSRDGPDGAASGVSARRPGLCIPGGLDRRALRQREPGPAAGTGDPAWRPHRRRAPARGRRPGPRRRARGGRASHRASRKPACW
jgi:hypothetical protein